MPGRMFAQVHRIARAKNNVITTRDAVEVGIAPNTLQQMARRGALLRISHGVYRLAAEPESGLDRIAAAQLWARCADALVSHGTALALTVPFVAEPEIIEVTVPVTHRVRRPVPSHIHLWRADVPRAHRTEVEGIPCTTPVRSIKDSSSTGVNKRTVSLLIREAYSGGILTYGQAEELGKELLGIGGITIGPVSRVPIEIEPPAARTAVLRSPLEKP